MMRGNFFLFTILLVVTNSVFAQQSSAYYVLDMVHNNPGEALTQSAFNNPKFLKQHGYTGQVMNDFTFAHAAITFDKFDKRIFPIGSKERAWVMQAADRVRANIKAAHAAGIKVYYFTDIIVLPKTLVNLYHDEICDASGKISFERPKTIEIHKLMLQELFATFPDLDGLVIRTGETYLNNVPYHTGNGPITNGEQSHIKLLNLLREEVCVKLNKTIFYRTWSFGGMHDSVAYYLNVTNSIAPHPNLIFSIKHTKGDYHRTFDFNPTLGLGNHQQIVEVQCQREYEGKGAYPNYVMNGVINGFEEYQTTNSLSYGKSLSAIARNKNFAGIWSWSRGGGWVGPYISNELWCKLNAFVIAHWGQHTALSEEAIFNQFMDNEGIVDPLSRTAFRQLCLLSAKAVLTGQASAKSPFNQDWTWWIRDHFLSGSDSLATTTKFPSEGYLYQAFAAYYQQGLLDSVLLEKQAAVIIWQNIVKLSQQISLTNKADEQYIKVSSKYGLLLQQIITEGWTVMALGFKGDKTGTYDTVGLQLAIKKYDAAWQAYRALKQTNANAATLYQPFAFAYIAPNYHQQQGMDASVNKYRKLVAADSKKGL
jgi:hypothetical protein